ncbi:uroporphyrinogen decarboxylase family protein [Candidatus Hydrogenedentota bacterium]
MNRRERLMATLRGIPVDRPPVSFYELNGVFQNPDDPDPFNIYSHPSWRSLLDLTREKTDLIVRRPVAFNNALPDPLYEMARIETSRENESLITTWTVAIGNHTLTARTRRDPDIATTWSEEHLLKNAEDVRAFLEIPARRLSGALEPTPVLEAESVLGDAGIVMIDTLDPLCMVASKFSVADYTVMAMTEPRLFRKLIDRAASFLLPRTKAVAKALPGRLWRICGPEYASPPFLPPSLFREYVCQYVGPMVKSIQRYGGFARIHSHGKLKAILDDIVDMNPDGLDPIEPPPQGDVELAYVRENYGKNMVLFGNLEVSDIEALPTDKFSEKVKRALDEGTSGEGRGFVLMPSACPYGRNLSSLTLRNYEKIIEIVDAF